MDKNNVLTPTLNLDKLDKDLYNWSLLPYELRKVSDDNCIKLYGCKNRELYNKLKEKILFNKDLDKEILVQSDNTVNISTNESFDYSNIDRKDLIGRIGLAKSMNNDVLTAILYPYDPELINDNNYRSTYRSDFNEIYNKFIRLSDKYQKYSNLYSIQLFGYNVRSMYQLIHSDIEDDNDNISSVIDRDYVNSNISFIEESITEDLIDKNIISLFKCKILHCRDSINEASTEGQFARTLKNEINGILYRNTCKNDVKSIVPYFTINEYNNIIIEDGTSEYDKNIVNSINNDRDYYNTIIELYNKFKASNNTDIISENTLLRLGWNPYIDPKKYMSKARDRQIKWYDEHCTHIIDISNIEVNNISNILESSYNMRKLYEDLDLYPVYIILSYSGSTFAKIIKRVKSSTFCHAGITLDSDLKQILTFEFNDKDNKGFMIDTFDKYIEYNKDMKLDILCLFVNSDTINKLNDIFAYFTSNKNKTSYNFKNLLDILRNKAKDNDPYNLSLVCSQFVDTVLKLADIDITNKSSNLVIPQDFEDINHPRVYKLYNGLGRKYNELKLESKIELLIKTSNPVDIRYNDFISEIANSNINFISNRYRIIDNDIANNILQEFYDYITPRSIENNSISKNSNNIDELLY